MMPAPGARMGWFADRIWPTIEVVYARWFRLRVIGNLRTSILRLGLRHHWGSPLVLPDGTLLRRGDRLGELHFRNDVMSALLAEAPGPVRALTVMRARGLESLVCLARTLEADPALHDVRAVFGETLLWHTVRRLGFWDMPIHGRTRRRIVSTFQRLLVQHYSPAGWARLERLGATETRLVWISRPQLLRLYGPGSNPLVRRHPAVRRRPGATPREAALA